MGAFAKKLFQGNLTDTTHVINWEPVGDLPALYIEHSGGGTLDVKVVVSPVMTPGAPSPSESGDPISGSSPVQWVPELFKAPFRKLELQLTATGDCSDTVVYIAFVKE